MSNELSKYDKNRFKNRVIVNIHKHNTDDVVDLRKKNNRIVVKRGENPKSNATPDATPAATPDATPAAKLDTITAAKLDTITAATSANSITAATPADSITAATSANSITAATPADSITAATPAANPVEKPSEEKTKEEIILEKYAERINIIIEKYKEAEIRYQKLTDFFNKQVVIFNNLKERYGNYSNYMEYNEVKSANELLIKANNDVNKAEKILDLIDGYADAATDSYNNKDYVSLEKILKVAEDVKIYDKNNGGKRKTRRVSKKNRKSKRRRGRKHK